MCWKKILDWFKPDPVVPITGNKVALLFAIGDYPGSQNDLIGPPYDSKNADNFLKDNYPEFTVKKFTDSEVTGNIFKTTILSQLAVMKPDDTLVIYYSGHGTNGIDSSEPDGYREGLYLYDRIFWDDEFTVVLQSIKSGAKVIIVLDSCFARGSTTPKNIGYESLRFVQTQEVPRKLKRIKSMLRSDTMNYIVLAACQENQTAADIGPLGGAFTYHWLKAWKRTYNWTEWNDKTALIIKQTGRYSQIPNIEGDKNLMEQIVLT